MAEVLVALLLSVSGVASSADGGEAMDSGVLSDAGIAAAAESPTPEKSPAAIPDGGPLAIPAIPPELTVEGLQDELKRSARERRSTAQKMDQERTALAAERVRLQQLASDVEKARQGLREDTDRLREQTKKRPLAAANEVPAETPSPAVAKSATSLAQASKTLKGMRPDQAAQLLLHLDSHLAVELLGHMRPSDAGEVLEKLKPEQAAPFVAALAARAPTSPEVHHE